MHYDSPMTTQEKPQSAMCSCGQYIEWLPEAGKTESEYMHYVWAVRQDGTRSNLGYCPITLGLAGAMSAARGRLAGAQCEYQGARY
jgi:hypothetical protein